MNLNNVLVDIAKTAIVQHGHPAFEVTETLFDR